MAWVKFVREDIEIEVEDGISVLEWMCEDNIVEVPFDKEHLSSKSLVLQISTEPTRQ